MDCMQGMKEIEENSIDLILADPPYGIDYQSVWGGKRFEKIENDKVPFTPWMADAYRILKDGGRMLCFYRWDVQDAFYGAMSEAGFTVRSQIVWDKVIHGMGDLNGNFAPQHELILYATKGKYQFQGKRPKTVFRFQRVTAEKMVHPNEKPLALMVALLNAVTKKEDTVVVPFAGSGVDVEACIRSQRNVIGFEIDEKYVHIANKRITPWLQQVSFFGGL